MSALANLAGMFPPQGDQVWNKDINWQPIPVRIIPAEEDRELSFTAPCARLTQLQDTAYRSEGIMKLELQNQELYEYLESKTGLKNLSLRNAWHLWDTLSIEAAHNLTLPTWANITVLSKLTELSATGRRLIFKSLEQRRLTAGPLIKEWVQLCGKIIANTSSTVKMNMYSGHDLTIDAVMLSLNVSESLFPPLTSTLIMELHEASPASFHIELYFRNKTSADPDDDTQPHPLTIPELISAVIALSVITLFLLAVVVFQYIYFQS